MAMASSLKFLAALSTILLVIQHARGACLPLEDCVLECTYGLAYDSNECHICACLEPCKGYDCGQFEMCEVREAQCIRAPCPPIATCVPKTTTTDSSPTTSPVHVDDCLLEPSGGLCSASFTRWFFNVTSLTCQQFSYTGCGGNDNNFENEGACLARCLPTSVGCSVVSCPRPCQLQFDTKGCNVCVCPDASCMAVSCMVGEECQMTPGHCDTLSSAVCYSRPQCLPVIGVSTSTRPCPYIDCELMKCDYGFKNDDKGCKTCVCYDPCETYSCPVNQRCVVLPSDCGVDQDCRDGPMRICTDVTTAPAVIRNKPTAEELMSCCSAGQMASECESICVTNFTVTSSTIGTLLQCAKDLNTYFKCMGTGQSFTSCCERKGVGGSCYDFCAGSGKVDTSNMHIFTQCLMSNDMNAVIQCYQDGAADTTSASTVMSTSSMTTVDKSYDICALAPDSGPCEDTTDRWFYNYTMKTCQKFQYHGCLGNGNNFMTEADCAAACSVSKPNCPQVICDEKCHLEMTSSGCNTCACPTINPTSFPSTEALTTKLPTAGITTPAITEKLTTQELTTKLTTNPLTKPTTDMPTASHAELQNCCSEQGVESKCMPFCSYHPAVTQQMLPALLSCETYMSTGLQCAKRNQTFTDCCKKAGVTGECLNGCGKQMVIFDHDCIQIYYAAMSQCFETGQPDVPCPVVHCDSRCQYGQQKDSKGCNTCACEDPCKNMTCPAGQECTYKSTPVCDDDICDITYTGHCTKKPDCPAKNCSNNCTFGYTKDLNDCDTCQCLEPCKNVTCDQGYSCQVSTSVVCVGSVCESRYTGSCAIQCPKVMCRMFCQYGWAKNSTTGCEICDCYDPCKDMQCAKGQECVPNDVPIVIGKEGAFTKLYIGQCYNVCDSLNCDLKCEYGLKKDNKNCDMCTCYEPCENIVCSSGNRCQPTASDVTATNPYSIIGMCLPTPVCKEVSCDMECGFGLMKDINLCDYCKCYDPCQNVTCDASTTCKVQSAEITPTNLYPFKGVCKPKCSDVTCMMFCDNGFVLDDNDCPVCKCYNPCENVTCDAGSACKIVPAETTILNKYSVRGACKPQCSDVTCMMFCDNGFVKDDNDCPVCKCYNPCEGITCDTGLTCQVINAPETNSKYDRVGVCQPVCNDPMCLMFCQYGFKKNINGCEICECYDPCQNVTCDSMSVCQPMAANVTDVQPYHFTAHCERCTGMLCRIICPYGMVQLTDNCPLCQCFDPCQDMQCELGAECEVVEASPQEGGLQLYKGICKDKCKPLACNQYCKYGKAKDSNGCNTCDCYDPCKNMTCDTASICYVAKVNTTNAQLYKYEAQCVRCTAMLCDIFCDYGTVVFTEGCSLCKCFEPCKDVQCDGSKVCVPKRVEATDISLQMYKGVCTEDCSNFTCSLFCDNGFMKDSRGCDVCECYDPCQTVKCEAGSFCQVEAVANTSSQTYYNKAVCRPFKGCAQVMCSNDCPLGYAKDSMGCPGCECENPCIAATCPFDSSCQVVEDPRCTVKPCPPVPKCVAKLESCTDQQAVYQRTFANNLVNTPELNCALSGDYKSLQCDNSYTSCSCVTKTGTTLKYRMSLNQAIPTCYDSDSIFGSIKIHTNFSVIKPGNGSQFKQIMSTRIANLLKIDESDVTITSYYEGSIMVDYVVSDKTTDMNHVRHVLDDLAGQEFYVTYDGSAYLARMIYYGSLGQQFGFTTQSYYYNNNRKAFLLQVILIPILGSLTILLTILGVCCLCKKCNRKTKLLPDSARSSRSFDSIVEHSDIKTQKGYDNPTYNVEKVAPSVDKMSTAGSTAA